MMIRGEVLIDRPIKPGVTHINLSGEYDYDRARDTIVLTRNGARKEFTVRGIKDLLLHLANLEQPRATRRPPMIEKK